MFTSETYGGVFIAEYPEAVIDFGAGVGPYESRLHLTQVQSLLAPIPNIFLILPSPDLEKSLTILRQRDEHPPADLNFDINAHFLHRPGYTKLSKHTIYNHGKSPAQSCVEVIAQLQEVRIQFS